MSRAECDGCGRPESVCLCSHLVHYTLPFNLTIWQDPDESRHPLSTAPLLERTIDGCRRLVGDQFAYNDVFSGAPVETVALLYPADDSLEVVGPEIGRDRVSHVLVLDGTWRKVRRLTLMNPWLLNLPRVSLSPQTPSAYLRASQHESGVSTLEAVLMLADLWYPGNAYLEGTGVLKRMSELQERMRKR